MEEKTGTGAGKNVAQLYMQHMPNDWKEGDDEQLMCMDDLPEGWENNDGIIIDCPRLVLSPLAIVKEFGKRITPTIRYNLRKKVFSKENAKCQKCTLCQ
ncbi:hypothetical protein ACFLY1_00520 [Patescibacteria group bacterium]